MTKREDNEPPTIEHNPDETRPTNTIWWILWPMVGLAWVGQLMFGTFQWDSFALGGFTVLVLTTWAIEVTGNKVPSWMIPRPRKRYLPDPVRGEPAFGPNAKRFFVVTAIIAALVIAIVWIKP